MAALCSRCGMKRSASVHSARTPGGHAFIDASAPGLKPMSEGMRNFRKASGYDAAVEAAKGTPCQIVSPVCTGAAEHLHEDKTRGRNGGLRGAIRAGTRLIPACDACNGYCSENPVWATERGFLVSTKGQR